MADFIDQFPSLTQVVDIGGERYFMGPQKPIELGFKSRKDYIDSFGTDKRTEYLLRRYMFIDLKPKRELRFDSPKDKSDLIVILKKRASQLKTSSEFTSSLLKNTIFQRSFINIQKLIHDLEGTEFQGELAPLKMPNIDILPCTKAKKYVKQIPDNRLYEMILEIAWYLLHPDQVPSQIQCDWAKLIKQLDTLRISDIITDMQQADSGAEPSKDAYNYFKKINLADFVKSETNMKTALDQAKDIAMKAAADGANTQIKNRLKILLDILQIKKYLTDDLPVDDDKMKIIDAPEGDVAKKIGRDMPVNPMAGGASKTLDKPIGIAMQPMYDYFKVVYDPIYTLLDSDLNKYSKNSSVIKEAIIPKLTTILHICNNLKPSETTEGGGHTYGVYKITNVDKDIITFFNKMLGTTTEYVGKFSDPEDKNRFNKQLFELPKIRLSSLLNKFLNSKAFLDPETIPYIQFFTIGGNMNLMTKDEFINPKTPEMKEEAFNAVNEYFQPTDLYILCTKSDNTSENIPMNVYQIDYDTVDVASSAFEINNLADNYFNKNKEPELYLEKLVKLSEYVVFNDAELALSIFLLFKYLLPV